MTPISNHSQGTGLLLDWTLTCILIHPSKHTSNLFSNLTQFLLAKEGQILWNSCGCNFRLYDGCILIKTEMMEDFSRLATSHAATCGNPLKLVVWDTSQGVAVEERWKYTLCLNELELNNWKLVKTKVLGRIGISLISSQRSMSKLQLCFVLELEWKKCRST